jgi:carbonic anhydrase
VGKLRDKIGGKLNPLKKLEEFKATLPDLKALSAAGKSQSESIRIQVEEILKQTVLMERWAKAQELQLEQLERVACALESLAEQKVLSIEQ